MERLEELRARFKTEPLVQAFNATLENLDKGSAIVSMRITSNMVIVERIANGGILATIGNTASVYAAMSLIPAGHTRAIHLDIDFLKPVREGEIVVGSAEVDHETNNFVRVKFKIKGPGPEPRATGRVLYYKPR